MTTATGGKGIKEINHIPSISLHSSQGFKFFFPVNGKTLGKHFPKNTPSFGQNWYEIQIIQVLEESKYVFGIFIERQEVLSMENSEPELFEDVNVYMTSPWYKSQRGSIRGLRIENRKPEEKMPETSMLDFYNNVMTFNESMVEATCCSIEGSPMSVSCGQGKSCSAVCYSMDAALCPSRNCKDCQNFKEEGKGRGGRSDATLSASAFSHCTSNGCRVSGTSGYCCFHPICSRGSQCIQKRIIDSQYIRPFSNYR